MSITDQVHTLGRSAAQLQGSMVRCGALRKNPASGFPAGLHAATWNRRPWEVQASSHECTTKSSGKDHGCPATASKRVFGKALHPCQHPLPGHGSAAPRPTTESGRPFSVQLCRTRDAALSTDANVEAACCRSMGQIVKIKATMIGGRADIQARA
ncbi:hypothetical protein MRS44_006353 [Fusarium solani]|jgi:hypothetical protein|uniref:uncharacterized protein n=1 Tax=Fusarium solani TaxID=169388 RepID=UPI0032C4A159|nr:hypothetical protein MRS44_006353 [Fusarium solani]